MGTKRRREALPEPRLSVKSSQSTRRSARIQNRQDATPKPKKPTTPFPFFRLPLELRNMIYRYLVVFPKGVVRAKSMNRKLRLWRANRQCSNEVSALFYSENVFKFYSGYVHAGEDPFGPSIHRIRRCYLHLSYTPAYAEDFMQWYLSEFVKALKPSNQMLYLLIRPSVSQYDQLTPLENLSGIRFAQINTSSYYGKYDWPESDDELDWDQSNPTSRLQYRQKLERYMMSDGKSKAQITKNLGNTYCFEPALTVHLWGKALENAQMHGGWTDDGGLYEFLRI